MNTIEYTFENWIEPIEMAVKNEFAIKGNDDAAHDMGHFKRVSTMSVRFAKEENANELVTYAAGMLHDIVNLPKSHPESKNSSFLASSRALIILNELNFPNELIPNVCHAIHAHSFSANIETETIEAKCVQDADRMEALGAFGLMRVFYISGKLGSKIMHESDPEGTHRNLDDKEYALDHFHQKLFKLQNTMKTKAGSETAKSLTQFLENFWIDIIQNQQSGPFQIADVYYNAGKNNALLFNSEDPFALKRDLNPDQFALDALLPSNDPHILKFINQLKFELNGYQN